MAEDNTAQNNEIIFYATPEGDIKIEIFFNDETFGLNQKKMAELFGVDVRTVNEYLQNICKTNELDREEAIRKIRIVQKKGNRDVDRDVDFFNLDAIIVVCYRVNSYQATQFRIWTTKILREFIIKGFVLDDEGLKQGKDYFDELLERIREIRASERRFYLKITDIYEQCIIDYKKDAQITQKFSKYGLANMEMPHLAKC